MKILSTSKAFPAFDGRIILRTVIDKPAEQGSRLLNYLSDYSIKIEAFSREKLFLRLCELYEASHKGNQRLLTYHYIFKILCTYENEDTKSCLLISRIYHGSDHLYSNADAVIAIGDSFVPPKLISKQNALSSVLVLDNEANPCWADVSGGGIIFTPAENCLLI